VDFETEMAKEWAHWEQRLAEIKNEFTKEISKMKEYAKPPSSNPSNA
jgi:hypothetical protein